MHRKSSHVVESQTSFSQAPNQLSTAHSTEKQGEQGYTISLVRHQDRKNGRKCSMCMGAQGPEQQEEQR